MPQSNFVTGAEIRKAETNKVSKLLHIRHLEHYAMIELDLLAVVWGLQHFSSYVYGKATKLLTDHQALEPLNKRNRSNQTNI